MTAIDSFGYKMSDGVIPMTFTYNEISAILKTHFKSCEYELRAIGNHELNRHYVFEVIDEDDNAYVMKFYYKEVSFEREYASLKLLELSPVKTATVLASGNLNMQIYWILIDKLPGELFENRRFGMAREELNQAYFAMGREMALIHTCRSFDFYGSWNMYGDSYNNIKTFRESFIKSRNFDIEAILTSTLPNQREVMEAIETMKNQYDILYNLEGSVLCHRDFDGRNVLIDKINGKYNVTATLDFEHAIPFHRSWDFVNMHHKYFIDDPVGMDAFYEGYRSICEVEPLHGQLLSFYLLCIGIQICSWAFNRSLSYYDKGLKLIRENR